MKRNVKKVAIFVALFVSLITLTVVVHAAGESMGYKLACIDGKCGDKMVEARFHSLLRQLSSTYAENPEQIADLTVTAQRLLKEEGVSESLLNIMEGMNQLFSTTKGLKYAEYASAYITLRVQGRSHASAIVGLKALLQGLGLY